MLLKDSPRSLTVTLAVPNWDTGAINISDMLVANLPWSICSSKLLYNSYIICLPNGCFWQPFVTHLVLTSSVSVLIRSLFISPSGWQKILVPQNEWLALGLQYFCALHSILPLMTIFLNRFWLSLPCCFSKQLLYVLSLLNTHAESELLYPW